MANNTKDLTPEQKIEEEFLTVDENALATATQAMIGVSHPSNVQAQRNFLGHYFNAVKDRRAYAAQAKTDKDFDPDLTPDQRRAKQENEARKVAEAKAHKEWAEKNPEAAKAKALQEKRDEEDRLRNNRDTKRDEGPNKDHKR